MSEITGVREEIVKIILDVQKPERPDLSDHSKPLLSGTLDSLDFASVLMAIEDHFGLQLADQDTEHVGSIDKLVTFIETKKRT